MNVAGVTLALELELVQNTSLTMSEDVTVSMSRRDTDTLPNCGDCPRRNGHGRTLEDMDEVIDHLLESHGVVIYIFD
jgi:hypothetical protein